MSADLVDAGFALAALCAAMAVVAALVYRIAGFDRPWSVPAATVRGAAQLAVVSLILAAALRHLWSAAAVLVVMFAAASVTAARRARAGRSGVWLTGALAAGMAAVLPPMLVSGVVPLQGVALIPIGGIVLGNTMTATAL